MVDASYLQDPGESHLQQSAFEGLFVKVLKVDGDFARELKDAGFDPARQQPLYPSPVFKACIEIACRRLYPDRPTPEAMRLLAAQFVDGFFDTIVGKVVVVVLPLLSADAFLKRYPRFFGMAAPGVKMTMEKESEGHWRVVLRDRAPLPDFNAGVFECLLPRFGVKPQVKVVEQSRWHFVLSITW
jgi:uncharacterized protein (TIGR02265 family)